MALFARHTFFNLMKFFLRFMPNHIKRMMFWVALSEKMERKNESSLGSVKEINQALKLVNQPDAMVVPAKTAVVLWDELKDSEKAVLAALDSEDSCEELSSFANTVPACLKYASDDFMEQDFKRAIEARKAMG